MQYTIEYLENGAREWQKFELTPRDEWAARLDFADEIEEQIDDWEAARLVGTDEKGTERKLAEWALEVPTAEPSDLGISLRRQLVEIKEAIEALQEKVERLLSDCK